MKTYTLDIIAPEDEEMVTQILEALHKRRVIRYAPAPIPPEPQLTDTEAAADVVRARQQPGISLAEARGRFGV
ncbi:MAG: hypothetical protein M3Y54_19655 [Bacteroidota bacterium]|nr:hypothetical protein [Bacteroidota bacterium]